MPDFFGIWLEAAPIAVVGAGVLAVLVAASVAGTQLRKRHDSTREEEAASAQEGFIISAVLGLLALLMGFTFALAIDRFDTRRLLVLEDANAIRTAYLQAQVLDEPHRARISGLLVAYTDNMVQLANAEAGQNRELLAKDDWLLTELWSAALSAFDSIRQLDFSSALMTSMNNVITLDASRRAARRAHVPTPVFLTLLIYLAVTAALLGYVLFGWRARVAGAITLALLTMAFVLIVDIDRPTGGTIRETQGPMEELQKSLRAQPARAFDSWRAAGPKTNQQSDAHRSRWRDSIGSWVHQGDWLRTPDHHTLEMSRQRTRRM